MGVDCRIFILCSDLLGVESTSFVLSLVQSVDDVGMDDNHEKKGTNHKTKEMDLQQKL